MCLKNAYNFCNQNQLFTKLINRQIKNIWKIIAFLFVLLHITNYVCNAFNEHINKTRIKNFTLWQLSN